MLTAYEISDNINHEIYPPTPLRILIDEVSDLDRNSKNFGSLYKSGSEFRNQLTHKRTIELNLRQTQRLNRSEKYVQPYKKTSEYSSLNLYKSSTGRNSELNF